MMFIKNKKGFLDTLFIIVIGIVMIMIVLAIFMAQTYFNNGMVAFAAQSELSYVNETVTEILVPTTERTRYFLDFVLMMVIFGSGLVVMLINYIFPRDAVFLALNVMVSLSLTVAVYVIQEAMTMFQDNAIITAFLDSLPFTTWILQNYLIIYILFIFMILIGTFMKPKQ